MDAYRLHNDPTVLEVDDQEEFAGSTDLDLPGQNSSQFENRSQNRLSWSSWDDSSLDGSGGGFGFLG